MENSKDGFKILNINTNHNVAVHLLAVLQKAYPSYSLKLGPRSDSRQILISGHYDSAAIWETIKHFYATTVL